MITNIIMLGRGVVAFYNNDLTCKRVLGVKDDTQFQFYPQYEISNGEWFYWLGEQRAIIYSASLDWALEFVQSNEAPTA